MVLVSVPSGFSLVAVPSGVSLLKKDLGVIARCHSRLPRNGIGVGVRSRSLRRVCYVVDGEGVSGGGCGDLWSRVGLADRPVPPGIARRAYLHGG